MTSEWLGQSMSREMARRMVRLMLVLAISVSLGSSPAKAGVVWSAGSSMPTARYGLAAAVADEKLYVIGGSNGGYGGVGVNVSLGTVEMYDPGGAAWVTKQDMPTVRNGLAAVELNGLIYAIGGYSTGWGFNTGKVATVEVYNTASNTWTVRASMPTARSGLAAAVVNGKIYTFGGASLGTNDKVEEYDPILNGWTTKASMPTARSGLGAATVNGIIYVIGGNSSSFPYYLSTVEAYDPLSNTWTTRAPMPTGRSGLVVVALEDKLYAIGGRNADSLALSVVEEYDTVANAWRAVGNLAVGRDGSAAGVAGPLLFVTGGYGGTYLNGFEIGRVQPDSTTNASNPAGLPPDPFADGSIWKASFIILPNVLRLSTASTLTFRLRGEPLATSTLNIYDETGGFIASFQTDLDSDGWGLIAYNGASVNGSALALGVYWAVANGGGIHIKQRFLILE